MDLSSFLLDALRGALILAAAMVALPLLRRSPASVRRALLVAAFLSLLGVPLASRALAASRAARVVALPFLVRVIPVEQPEQPRAAPPVVTGAAIAQHHADAHFGGRGPSRVVPWSGCLGIVWALGTAVLFVRLGWGIHRARRVVRRAAKGEAHAFDAAMSWASRRTGVHAEVAVSDDVDAPAVAGMFRSVVLMPRAALDWTEERWRVVLLHEFAHVARRDCVASVLVQIACALHWFDPLAWLARARLYRERELAADEDVVKAGTLASDYAAHLLAIASASRPVRMAGALGMTAKRSELAERIESLVSRATVQRAPRALLPLIVVTVVSMSLALACVGPRSAAHVSTPPGATSGKPTPPEPTPSRNTEASSAEPSAAEPVHARGGSLADEVAQEMKLPAWRIELTIDQALQRIADDELSALAAKYQPSAATVIVFDPNTGGLLAVGDVATARRAFVTGSTIKPITVAAALEAGAIRLEQKFDCRPRAIGARTIDDPKERGWLDVPGIIEVSSNVGASRIFDAMKRERFDEMLARFHLGDASSVELANLPRGDVPKTVGLDAFDATLVAIGEGLTATPLQMVAAYGVFANRGEFVAPTLVRRVRDDSGRSAVARTAARERVMRAETAQTVMQLLERAVQGAQATGKGAAVQGVRVAGKTGTAEWTTPDGKEHTYASFIGIVPADAPRYVILVGAADTKETGATLAAPAFAKVAARVLGTR